MREKTDHLGRSETYLKSRTGQGEPTWSREVHVRGPQSGTPALVKVETVIDPQAPESVRRALEKVRAGKASLNFTEELKTSFPYAVAGAVVDWGLLEYTDLSPLQVTGAVVLMVLFADISTPSGRTTRRRKIAVKVPKSIDSAAYITPGSISHEVVLLLARAQRAKSAIVDSRAHREGRIDADRNNVSLPEQEWQIAKALLAYTKAQARIPGEFTTPELRGVISKRQRALKEGLNSVTTKVAALEEYARQVIEFDQRCEEIQRALELTENDSDLLDLLAATAADEIATAEIKGLTEEVRALSHVYTQKLSEVRRSALVALEAA